jgi:hypothetical protein
MLDGGGWERRFHIRAEEGMLAEVAKCDYMCVCAHVCSLYAHVCVLCVHTCVFLCAHVRVLCVHMYLVCAQVHSVCITYISVCMWVCLCLHMFPAHE